MNLKFSFPFFYVILVFSFLILSIPLLAQQQKLSKEERKEILKDTLDGKLDFGRFLVDMHGFIPVPMIITEPALGGFGGVIAPVFIQPRKVEGYQGYVPPDITAGFGMYTVNGSWAIGAARNGSFPKAGIKYRAFMGYIDINRDFYRDLPVVGETRFPFNIAAMPVLLSVSKKIVKKKELFLGLQYMFTPTKVEPRFGGELPAFVDKLDLDNTTASLGVFADFDTRNTIFTPDKGLRVNVLLNMDGGWTGSDYTYQMLNASLNWFTPVRDNWISGLRTEVQHAFNDPPFYLLPSISLRGIPNGKYQGGTTILMETEQRFNLNLRWSLVGFGGLGKAIEQDESFGDGKTVYNVGTGFRYLLARVFKLRAGVDIALGPDTFGYYIVFGHNWNR